VCNPAGDDESESGFTLIELLVMIVVLPLVIGAIGAGLLAVFSLQSGVTSRLSDSSDAQVVSAYYETDVQSAQQITTSNAAPQCGTGSQLLGFEWSFNPQTSAYQTVVSYVEKATGPTYSLIRQYCSSGVSSTPTSSTTISSDLLNSQPPPLISPVDQNTVASAGWISTQKVTKVAFVVTEPRSNYTYTLAAVPKSNLPLSLLGSLSTGNPTASCGFAAPGTGTYASTLCFIDFSSYNPSLATSGGQAFSVAVTGTPFTISFNLATSGGVVASHSFPTYSNAPVSEAFLGNNGFYTGVPGHPALYQSTSGTTSTLTFTNFKVFDSNGLLATNWELVTGDAESTDAGESLTFTSDQNLNLIPNSSTSPVGNDCDSVPPGTNAQYLTGIGTPTVMCGSPVNSDKTGTIILSALTPKSLKVVMVGAGLEAAFVGLLLP
jgi:Tfp pilus assembly protein PilV